MTSRRGRGRRDNGLDAALWSPLRDVDPRIGEHLLDVLSVAGIAAYLEPSADVEPYTRTVSLPSPPSDRLFVDRARRREARGLVDEHVAQDTATLDREAQAPDPPSPARASGPERATVRPDLDEDAEWARIVAAFEAENGRLVVTTTTPPRPPQPSCRPRPPRTSRRSSTGRRSTSNPRRRPRCRCRPPPRCTPSCSSRGA